MFFFFKQKTAYEMRISDWSSDVCSSDLTVLADFTRAGERIVMLRGGDGGRGNASYKSSTNRAPRQHGVGWPGQEMYVWLRLKLLRSAERRVGKEGVSTGRCRWSAYH